MDDVDGLSAEDRAQAVKEFESAIHAIHEYMEGVTNVRELHALQRECASLRRLIAFMYRNTD